MEKLANIDAFIALGNNVDQNMNSPMSVFNMVSQRRRVKELTGSNYVWDVAKTQDGSDRIELVGVQVDAVPGATDATFFVQEGPFMDINEAEQFINRQRIGKDWSKGPISLQR